MKDIEYHLKYVNVVLKIVLIVLLVYAIYTGWIFFSSVGKGKFDFDESIVPVCNSLADMNREYEFCCDKRDVFIDGDIVEMSCFDLDRGDLLEEIVDFDCSDFDCSEEDLPGLPIVD